MQSQIPSTHSARANRRQAAEGILDRLMHRCAMLEFEGRSYRLKEAAARIAVSPE